MRFVDKINNRVIVNAFKQVSNRKLREICFHECPSSWHISPNMCFTVWSGITGRISLQTTVIDDCRKHVCIYIARYAVWLAGRAFRLRNIRFDTMS